MQNQTKKWLRLCGLLLVMLAAKAGIAQPVISCTLVITPPVSDVCPGQCVSPYNGSNGPNGDSSTTCFNYYYWSMPGGTPSSYWGIQPPCVTYAANGTYTITCTVSDSFPVLDSANSASIIVHVSGDIAPVLSIAPNPICENQQVNFSCYDSTGYANYIYWDFGDGGTQGCSQFGCPFNTIYTYAAPGSYNVTATVAGQCDTVVLTQTVNVLPPSAAFTYLSTCRVQFFNDTTCNIGVLSETWNFGDGSPVVSGSNPIHSFPQNNVGYVVTHTITTANGSYTYSQTVFQVGGPTANIVGNQINNCNSGFFTYTANPCQPGLVYSWAATGGTVSSPTGCTTNINWTNSNGGTLILTVFDPVSDCYGYDTLLIPPCCSPTGQDKAFTNTTASAVLGDPANVLQVTGSNFTYAGHIVINGVFTIDVPFNFVNCQLIDMGTNAQIQVLAGKTLTFNNSVTSTKCGAMWDGIYLPNTSAKVNIINGSVIQQAKNAIVSNNGGNFLVENSTMKNNLKSIVVNPHPGAHPGKVRGSIFSMPGTFLTAFPALQAWQTKTLYAVEISGNADITIGDATTAAYRNTFRNMFCAIWSKQSHTTVVNAKIANLSATNNIFFINRQIGIVSEGGKQVANPPYYYQLQVGGYAANEPILTDSLREAVETRSSQRVYLYKNTFRNQRAKAVYILKNDNNLVYIQDNGILNTGGYPFSMQTAVDVVDCFASTVTITGNNINQQGNTVASQSGTGIRVANSQTFKTNVFIAYNAQIRRFRTGIWLQKLDGKNAVFVNNNTVGFFKNKPDYTSPHYGIKLEECSDVRIDHNLIQRFPGGNWQTGDAAFAANLHGIYFQDSPGSEIYQNDLRRMGNGIFGFNLSGGSTLACNDLWRCYNGFNFAGSPNNSNGADIGDQVLDQFGNPAPTGNVHTANFNFDLTGNIKPAVNWYESAAITENMQAGSLIPTSVNDPQVISTQNLCSTIYQLAPPPATARTLEAGNAITAIQTGNLSAETKQNMRKYVHRKLRENPNWMYLNTPQDTMYQNFYAQVNASNIGLVRNVEELAAVPDQVQALAVNNAITPADNIDGNLKTVNEIYTRTWMLDNYEFTPADSATLYMIATQNPGSEGAGVYSARVLLGLNVDDLTGNAYYHAPVMGEQQPVKKSALYPNPATQSVFLETNMEETQTGNLELFDLNGRLIKSQQVKGSGIVNMDVAEVQAGIYMVRLTVNGEAQLTERLVILK